MMRATPAALLAAFVLGGAVLLGGADEAAAKGPSWIITGGALGEQAVHVGFWDLDDTDGYPPGSHAVPIGGPAIAPSDGYAIYLYRAVERVAEDLRNDDPAFRFYADSGLLHDRRDHTPGADGQWYRVADDGPTRQLVAYAVARLGTGEAWPDPVTAAASAMGLLTPGATSFRVVLPRWRDQSVHGTAGSLIDDEALALGAAFVEAVSNPPAGTGGGEDAWWLVLGTTGWSGNVGRYTPPDPEVEGSVGRFWPGYLYSASDDDPYFTTSAEFDALMRRSIEIGEVHELAVQRAAEESRARMRARIQYANNVRLARLEWEAGERAALDFAAVLPAPVPRQSAAIDSYVGSLDVGIAAAALAVVVGVSLGGAVTLARSRRRGPV